MIFNITVNPLLELRLFYNNIKINEIHRTNKALYYPGGKGLNISRQLNKFNVENTNLLFLGGCNGKILRSLLTEDTVDFKVVSTKEETRLSTLVFDESNNTVTSFFSPDPKISLHEVKEFKSKLEKMVKSSTIVTLAGSSPTKETDEIFYYTLELARKYDKISILDTYGEHLANCLELAPSIIHNNKNEIKKSLNVDLLKEADYIDFLKYLYSKRINMSFITDGHKPIYASKFDFHFKIIPPKIKELFAVGSGDAFVTGLVYGMEKYLSFEKMTKLATSLGALNAQNYSVCSVEEEEALSLAELIILNPLGKELKLIDDSPTI